MTETSDPLAFFQNHQEGPLLEYMQEITFPIKDNINELVGNEYPEQKDEELALNGA